MDPGTYVARVAAVNNHDGGDPDVGLWSDVSNPVVIGVPLEFNIEITNQIGTILTDAAAHTFGWQRLDTSTTSGAMSGVRWSASAGSITQGGRFTPPTVTRNTMVTVSVVVTQEGVEASASVTFTVTVHPKLECRIEQTTRLPVGAHALVWYRVVVTGGVPFTSGAPYRGVPTGTTRLQVTSGNVETVSHTATDSVGQTCEATASFNTDGIILEPELHIRISNPIDLLLKTENYDFNWSRDDTSSTTGDLSGHEWSATAGSITAAGLYTPPDVGVSTEVTVTFKVTQGGVEATASKTFNVIPRHIFEIAISALGSLDEDETHDFTWSRNDKSTTSGAFSVPQWSASRGSITAAGRYTPPDVSESTQVTVSVSVTQGGVLATASRTFNVQPVDDTRPDADLSGDIWTDPASGSAQRSGSVNDNSSLALQFIPSGRYDNISYVWDILGSGTRGTISPASDRSKATYTPPNVSGNRVFTVRCVATATGNDNTAAAGSSDTVTATFLVSVVDVTTVLPEVSASAFWELRPPSGAVRNKGASIALEVGLGNSAAYDTVSYAWSASAGSVSGSSENSTWRLPNAAGTHTVTCTISFRGDGRRYRSGSVRTATLTTTVRTLPDASVVANNITPDPFGDLPINSARTARARASGTYDTIIYGWSKVDGSGGIRINPAGVTAGILAPGPAGGVRLRVTITVTGNGTNAEAGTSAVDTDDIVFRVT